MPPISVNGRLTSTSVRYFTHNPIAKGQTMLCTRAEPAAPSQARSFDRVIDIKRADIGVG